ncbi:hypothetical protein B7463_g10336, partial [Scytalidium lignicola]
MLYKNTILPLLSGFAVVLGYDERDISGNSNAIYRSAAYYVNWAVSRDFTPQDLPADKLTHVLYAFANIMPDTGKVYLSNNTADTEIRFPGDSLEESGTNLYGCFKQLYLLKKKNRNLKILLSIGGWTYSSNFAAPASSNVTRSQFASTAVSLVADLGLDGLEIDWEYPASDADAANFVLLLQVVREALDNYGNSLQPPYNFTLTTTCPSGPSNYQILHIDDMDQYIDFWNLLAYDYAGSWSTVAANQANLFTSTTNPASTLFDTQTSVAYYISQVYGRSFELTNGLGLSFNGVGPGTEEVGVYDYKVLPLYGATEFNDNMTGSSYSYDPAKRELVSYDTAIIAQQKAAWVIENGLGGIAWWESSADATGNQSLIENVARALPDFRRIRS